MNKIDKQTPSQTNESNGKDYGRVADILKDLKRVLTFIPSRRKIQLSLLLVLQVTSGLSEVISLGAVLPFLSALSNASDFFEKPEMQGIITFLDIKTTSELILYSSAGFVIAFIMTNLLKMLTFLAQIRLSVAIGSDLNAKFCSQILHQDYEYHLNSNSSTLMSRSVTDLGSTLNFITSFMMIITQGIATILIISAIIAYDAVSALIIFSSITVIYLAVVNFNKQQIVRNGRVVSDNKAAALKILQLSLGSIRDVLLGDKQRQFIRRYSSADRAFRRASAKTKFLKFVPRIIIEIFAVSLLVFMGAYLTLSADGLFSVLPLIAALGLATVRILPAAQMIYNSYATMQSVHVAVDRCLKVLALPTLKSDNTPGSKLEAFKEEIALRDVQFRFRGTDETSPPSDWILKGVNLTIPVGSTVALVGNTGGGKTTISDVISGLLYPEEGGLWVDGKQINRENVARWQRQVACVPQAIFLLDSSVKENIAFGEKPENIDVERVREACRLAQISELIESRPNKYDEVIGENGLKLSGGQRQRIGLARALYQSKPLLVLDEATSALDNKTERAVMQTISNIKKDRTILIIAHRLDTIKKADLIYEIKDGRVVAQGQFDELLEKSETFREIAFASEH